jgi:hypothetical protein
MLLTLYLITVNTYASVDAPQNRGFSNIEVWMCGVQVPMLTGLLEYGYILSNNGRSIKIGSKSTDSKKKPHAQLDKLMLILNTIYFLIFNAVYWMHYYI